MTNHTDYEEMPHMRDLSESCTECGASWVKSDDDTYTMTHRRDCAYWNYAGGEG